MLLYPIQQPLFGQFVESKRNLWLCTSAGIQYAGKPCRKLLPWAKLLAEI